MQQEYSHPTILPLPHFPWIVKPDHGAFSTLCCQHVIVALIHKHITSIKGRRNNPLLLDVVKMLQHLPAMYCFSYISSLQLIAEYGAADDGF